MRELINPSVLIFIMSFVRTPSFRKQQGITQHRSGCEFEDEFVQFLTQNS
jgi:hypothetical protein